MSKHCIFHKIIAYPISDYQKKKYVLIALLLKRRNVVYTAFLITNRIYFVAIIALLKLIQHYNRRKLRMPIVIIKAQKNHFY